MTDSTDNKYNLAKTISYVYDKTGTRTKMTDPAGNNIAYFYDAAGGLTSVTEGVNSRAVYLYNAAGRRTRLTLGNDTYTTYAYDNANRLTSLYNRKSDNSLISSFDYLLDNAGNRTKMTLDGGDYVEYIYDGKYQLTSEARSGGTSYTRAFYYDPVGNRTRLVKNGPVTVTYAYDIADKLTKETEGETETIYLYDANGSLTRKTQGETVEAYGYNYENMMNSYDGPGTDNDTTYTYDVGLKRIKKDVNDAVTKFIYDGWNCVAEYDGSNTLQATYLTRFLDENLTVKRGGSTYYYHQDGLGSIRNITDASEVAQNTYDYYAFGSVIGSPTENVTNDYRFTARRWDSESSLYYYRARMYAPTYGRFTARDPVIEVNLYFYVGNNPVLLVDPAGHKAFKKGDKVRTRKYGKFEVVRQITVKDKNVKGAFCILGKLGFGNWVNKTKGWMQKPGHIYEVRGLSGVQGLAKEYGRGDWTVFIPNHITFGDYGEDYLRLGTTLVHEVYGHVLPPYLPDDPKNPKKDAKTNIDDVIKKAAEQAQKQKPKQKPEKQCTGEEDPNKERDPENRLEEIFRECGAKLNIG